MAIVEDDRKKMHPALMALLAISVAMIFISIVAFTVGPAVVRSGTRLLHRAPSREIPQLGSAAEYYQKALSYKDMGWTENARTCLQKAIALDREGMTKEKAVRFLNTKIPRYPVTYDAEQRNIEGYNLSAAQKNDLAKQVFRKCIKDYPKFEWPYNNLASIYLDENDPVAAADLCKQALAINPHYTNAICNLAQARIMQHDYAGAQEYLAQALTEDPEDALARQYKSRLQGLQGTLPVSAGGGAQQK